MTSNIHVETPDGKVKTDKVTSSEDPAVNKSEVADKKDIIEGPKSNPDPFANSNLEEKNKKNEGEGTGTEITDGEAG